jgi:hypothetical protein
MQIGTPANSIISPRRAADLGVRVRIGCHTFRATGITAYLEAGGTTKRSGTLKSACLMKGNSLLNKMLTLG